MHFVDGKLLKIMNSNDESEITLLGARKQIDDIEIGDYIEEELKAEKFGSDWCSSG